MKKRLITLVLIAALGVFAINLLAQNRDFYKMDNIQAEHYINASRTEVNKNNLSLACTYARKAVQANSWSQKAWANYDDVVKRLINKGKVKNFTGSVGSIAAPAPVAKKVAAPSPAPAPSAPAANAAGGQFEGC